MARHESRTRARMPSETLYQTARWVQANQRRELVHRLRHVSRCDPRRRLPLSESSEPDRRRQFDVRAARICTSLHRLIPRSCLPSAEVIIHPYRRGEGASPCERRGFISPLHRMEISLR